MPDQSSADFYLKYNEENCSLQFLNNWTIDRLHKLSQQIEEFQKQPKKIVILDGSELKSLDSAGAICLQEFIKQFKAEAIQPVEKGFNKQHQSLLKLVTDQLSKVKKELPTRETHGWLYKIGQWTMNHLIQGKDFLTFIGEFSLTFYHAIMHPLKMQWRSIASAIETTGYQALPIIGLMNFLIGIVLAYQLAEQLHQYGADIYIVDITGIGILREFAPLITAIILAGRTSTSFAALLGTMKVNQEIDALRTMGISPMARLVLPRVIGLLIALPLLTVWADIFGILGGMVMTQNILGINYHAFLQRFSEDIALRHYVLGLIKTPVFALIVAGVGCFQGFQTSSSAQSVGEKTTKAAVQAIFLVIIVDALFSILFSKMGY